MPLNIIQNIRCLRRAFFSDPTTTVPLECAPSWLVLRAEERTSSAFRVKRRSEIVEGPGKTLLREKERKRFHNKDGDAASSLFMEFSRVAHLTVDVADHESNQDHRTGRQGPKVEVGHRVEVMQAPLMYRISGMLRVILYLS